MENNTIKGLFFALAAAALNGSIGIFSKQLFAQHLNIQSIAFFKTLIAFFLISLLVSRLSWQSQKEVIQAEVKSTKKLLLQIAFCAFLGIFVLFFFETTAYAYGQAANVVVVLMAAAAISSLIGGAVLMSEPLRLSAIMGTLVAIFGVFMISWSGSSHWLSVVYAVLAGSGYGLFSVFIKKFKLNGGLLLTRILMLFGAIYLFVPFIQNMPDINWNASIVLNLMGLAVFPTLLGFYCTTKSLVYLSASKVQVTELSEPIFAMILAYFILHEIPHQQFFIGAFCIIVGIMLINQLIRLKGKQSVKLK